MADLQDRRLIYAKGFLFLLGGILASALLIAEHPTAKVAVLLLIAVWSFARFYYFAFYVIGRYVDPGYRFSGLWSFAGYLLRKSRGEAREPVGPSDAPIDLDQA
jgi:hypothetical protein